MASHLSLAHDLWEKLLKPSDHVIDATCGNGKDTLVLAGLVSEGHVYALDIQEEALKRAKAKTPFSNISFLHQSHVDLPDPPNLKLVVYNLGYLPGGDKSITTLSETTLLSISRAMDLLPIGGAISIICYPGHPEGAKEQKILKGFVGQLDPEKWASADYFWTEKAPNLIFITKKFTL